MRGKKPYTDEQWIEKFWPQVDQRGACWLWTGSLSAKGYGVFDARLHGQRHYKAHRFSWALHNGPIPEGMNVCHTCDNRWCVNPEHLFLGTHQDNVADRMAKDRMRTGEDHQNSKLTNEQALYIYHSDKPAKEIAAELGVHDTVVYKIRGGKRWERVTGHKDRPL